MVRCGLSWLASFQIMIVTSFVLFAVATPLLGNVFEPVRLRVHAPGAHLRTSSPARKAERTVRRAAT
jgi:hypothetical protein